MCLHDQPFSTITHISTQTSTPRASPTLLGTGLKIVSLGVWQYLIVAPKTQQPRRQTHRVYQLRDDQQEALFNFLLAETDSPPPEPNPLPVLSSAQNRVRVDSEVAITNHNIYRDIWERKPLTVEEELTMERRPKSDLDYPELAEEVFRVNKQLRIALPGLRERSPSF
jgi:hypothetical protein